MRPANRTRMHHMMLLVAALVLVGGLSWLWTNRVEPQELSQDYLHSLGTRSEHAAMRPLPRKREVIIEPVEDADWVSMVGAYLPPPFGSGGQPSVQGMYDPINRRIMITGTISRLQSTLPSGLLQGTFRRTLRHEYGHAFIRDWLAQEGLDGPPFPELRAPASRVNPQDFPERLRPVVREYKRAVEDNVYGSAYFTSSLDEYLAESYARYLEGMEVPPRTRQLFDEAAE